MLWAPALALLFGLLLVGCAQASSNPSASGAPLTGKAQVMSVGTMPDGTTYLQLSVGLFSQAPLPANALRCEGKSLSAFQAGEQVEYDFSVGKTPTIKSLVTGQVFECG